MAIFRSLKALFSQSIRNHSNSAPSRAFFSIPASSRYPFPTPFLLPSNSYIRPHFLFRSRFLSPLTGPLFLSSPPWKLSQSATPLLLQSDAVRSFLKLRALNLLRCPAIPYSIVYDAPRLLNQSDRKEIRNGAEVDVGVGRGGISDSYLNLPNFISFARLLSGPLLGWMIIHDMYSSAFIGLAISGATDWLDGFMARKMRIDSVVGSYLDPLADKVLIGCVALAMVDKGLLNRGAVYKLANSLDWEWNSWHDFFNLNGAHAQKVEPLLISKVNTVFQLVLVAAALLQPEFGNEATLIYIYCLSWAVASTTVASTAAYGVQHWRHGASLMKKS